MYFQILMSLLFVIYHQLSTITAGFSLATYLPLTLPFKQGITIK